MEVIKVFNQTATSYKKYSDSITDFKTYTADWAKSSWKYTAVYKVVMTSPLLFALPAGLYLYMAGKLAIGKPDATQEEIVKAAKAACCHDFIMQTPGGYDTVVRASGSTLSGGERQRITIARAIIKNAPIIILDEATSFTDPENEDKLQEALGELIFGKTVIVIAHRLSTIVHADQIVVLDDGKVHRTGTQRELMQSSQIYRRLWQAHENVAGWSINVGGGTR